MTDSHDFDQDLNPPAEGPGKRLRGAREAKAMSQQDVAASLRLGVDAIEALERDDYEKLPAPIFVRGYLRNYAALLGLAAEPLVEDYSRCSGTSEQPTQLSKSVTRKQAHSGDTGVRYVTYLIVLVLAALVAIWWHNQGAFPWSKGENVARTAPATDTQTAKAPEAASAVPAPAATPPVVGQETARSTDATPAAPAAQTVDTSSQPASTDTPAAAPKAVESAPATVAETAVRAPTASVPASADQTSSPALPANDVLSLKFNQDCWVEVHDATGKRLMYRLGKAGETRTATGKGPFRVFLGNSPAVQIEYNGSAFDQSGYAHGKVARFSVGKTE